MEYIKPDAPRGFKKKKKKNTPVASIGRLKVPKYCFYRDRFYLNLLTGTYFTHEAKGADDAADADTAIINAEGGHNNSDEKKEYYI